MKTTRKIVSLLLALILSFSMLSALGASSQAEAAVSWSSLGISANNTIKCYVKGTSNVTTYKDNSLSIKSGSVYVSDEMIVKSIGKNSSGTWYAYVNYPISSGTKNAYIPLSAITSSTNAGTQMKATAKISNIYRRANTTKYGSSYISKGDTVYKLAVSGSYTQVLYNVSSGWKMAWIKTSDANSSLSAPAANGIVSQAEIDRAASKYSISASSNAYQALLKINSTYAKKSDLSAADKKGTLIFFFEGVGSKSSTSVHMNAMCVVVKNGSIVFISQNCTTIPDKPFSSTSHPTIRSGIYKFITIRHHPSGGKSNYAGLKIKTLSNGDVPVLRFSSKSSFSTSTSSGINVHARWTTALSNNSEGCLLVGKEGFSTDSVVKEYLAFCKAVGILNSSRTTMTYTTNYDQSVTGKLIIDRSYAKTYLTNVGYSASALTYLL